MLLMSPHWVTINPRGLIAPLGNNKPLSPYFKQGHYNIIQLYKCVCYKQTKRTMKMVQKWYYTKFISVQIGSFFEFLWRGRRSERHGRIADNRGEEMRRWSSWRHAIRAFVKCPAETRDSVHQIFCTTLLRSIISSVKCFQRHFVKPNIILTEQA